MLIASINIGFDIIDLLLPDANESWYSFYSGVYNGLPFALAFFLVAFPIYLFLTAKITVLPLEQMSHTVRVLRSVAVAIVLSVSFGIIAISGAIFMYNFLVGDLTIRFLFKFLFLVFIGILLFYYYRGVWKNTWDQKRMQEKNLGRFVLALYVVTIVAVVVLINPLEARDRNLTKSNLDSAESALRGVGGFYNNNKALPNTNQLRNYRPYPFERGSVRYRRDSQTSFSICFEVLTQLPGENYGSYPYKEFGYQGLGNQCFAFEVERNTIRRK